MTPRRPDPSPSDESADPAGMAGAVGQSVISGEFLDLAARVFDGRAAFRAEGLSACGTRVLQALGYLAPADLAGTHWAGRPGDPGLQSRAMALRGCGPATLSSLQAWFNRPWGLE